MPAPTHNQPEYSVSEISGALKRVVEDSFGYVRVRGEISGFKRAASGHLYLDLKDDKSVLNGVCWKGNAAKLAFKPEDGLEIIVTGKLTTYGGRSSYQIIIDSMEPAGAGALMALLEQRKKALAAEGLFDASRKKQKPFMPQVIGVVTSPTGAVIRDILHRLADRFPVHVLVWPVRVQGEGAAEEIAAAIRGFDALPPLPSGEGRSEGTFDRSCSGLLASAVNLTASPTEGSDSCPPSFLPRPDLLIVARGGGSIEDLWCFNEEVVVRAVAACSIPLISAVGHETDTTLIDYAADYRAPTPTAAAEMAVPVREEWMLSIRQHGERLHQGMVRLLRARRERIEGLARGIPHPAQLLSFAAQKLDGWSERLQQSLPAFIQSKTHQLQLRSARLQPQQLQQRLQREQQHIARIGDRLYPLIDRQLRELNGKLQTQDKLFQSLNYVNVLKRGFALVKTADGALVTSQQSAKDHASLRVQFHDGEVALGVAQPKPKKPASSSESQDSLF